MINAGHEIVAVININLFPLFCTKQKRCAIKDVSQSCDGFEKQKVRRQVLNEFPFKRLKVSECVGSIDDWSYFNFIFISKLCVIT